MPYRKKIFVLILVSIVLPITTLSAFGVYSMIQIKEELITRKHQYFEAKNENRLQNWLNLYAAPVRAKLEKLELGLQLQVGEVERRLAETGDGPLLVSDQDAGFVLSPGIVPDTVTEDIERLSTLKPVYQNLSAPFDNQIHCRFTILSNGLSQVYKTADDAAAFCSQNLFSLLKPQIANTVRMQQIVIVDPADRRTLMAAIAAVHRPTGAIAGVTGLVIPADHIFSQLPDASDVAAGSRILFAKLETESDDFAGGLPILARVIFGDQGQARLEIPSGAMLSSENLSFYGELRDELKSGISATRRTPFNGQDSFWTYGPVNKQIAALLIVPYGAALQPITNSDTFIQELIQRQLLVAASLLIVLVAVIFSMLLIFSRKVSRQVKNLSESIQRLANGDFETRAEIISHDEFGALGKTFNDVVTRLKDYNQQRSSLAVAEEIQQNLLPDAPPHVEGLDIAGITIYCDQTGGDYFDYFTTRSPEDGNIRVVVGDVSDHGVASALLMTTARALLRQRVSQRGSLASVVSDVNRHLCSDIKESGRFMALFLAEIDRRTRDVRWVRAGHDPALVYDPPTDSFRALNGKGPALGVLKDFEYLESRNKISPGQIIVFSTDGIRETRNSKGELFGMKKVQSLVRRNANLGAGKIKTAVIDAVKDFRNPLPQQDDVTLVVVKIQS